jgi:hypothetical protein
MRAKDRKSVSNNQQQAAKLKRMRSAKMAKGQSVKPKATSGKSGYVAMVAKGAEAVASSGSDDTAAEAGSGKAAAIRATGDAVASIVKTYKDKKAAKKSSGGSGGSGGR